MKNQICIIDDDEDIRGVLSYALDYEGISSITFESGASAEEYLNKLPLHELPCLLVIDYMMPDMNGVEFITHVKNKYPDTLAKIPTALSTGFFSEEIEHLPASIIKLEKPIELEDFIKLAKEQCLLHERPYSLF